MLDSSPVQIPTPPWKDHKGGDESGAAFTEASHPTLPGSPPSHEDNSFYYRLMQCRGTRGHKAHRWALF